MNGSPASIRFSLRTLLLAMAVCAVLASQWRSEGGVTIVALVLTWAIGALFLRTFSLWPVKERKWMFAWCAGLSGLSLPLLWLRGELLYANYYLRQQVDGGPTLFSLGFSWGLLTLFSSLIFCYVLLIVHSRRVVLSVLLILFHSWLLLILVNDLTYFYMCEPTTNARLLRGFCFALPLLALPWVIRWIQARPTTREEIESRDDA